MSEETSSSRPTRIIASILPSNPHQGGTMKFRLTKRRKWLLATGGALLLTATPSFALFGIGDIVFDPTSYASLVSQATTALNQLRTIENNVRHFSVKQQWQAV